MNLFILSTYDSAYCATMYENGFEIDLTTKENWTAFRQRFGVSPEGASMSDLQKILPSNMKIILCVDGDIEVADGLVREEVKNDP